MEKYILKDKLTQLFFFFLPIFAVDRGVLVGVIGNASYAGVGGSAGVRALASDFGGIVDDSDLGVVTSEGGVGFSGGGQDSDVTSGTPGTSWTSLLLVVAKVRVLDLSGDRTGSDESADGE